MVAKEQMLLLLVGLTATTTRAFLPATSHYHRQRPRFMIDDPSLLTDIVTNGEAVSAVTDTLSAFLVGDPTVAAAASVAGLALGGLALTSQMDERDDKEISSGSEAGKARSLSMTSSSPPNKRSSTATTTTTSPVVQQTASTSPSPPQNEFNTPRSLVATEKRSEKPKSVLDDTDSKTSSSEFNTPRSLVATTGEVSAAVDDIQQAQGSKEKEAVSNDADDADEDDITSDERQALAAFDAGNRGGLLQSLSRMASSVRISRRKLTEETKLRQEAQDLLQQAADELRDLEDKYELEQTALQKSTRSLHTTEDALDDSQRALRKTSEQLAALERERQSLRKLARQAVSVSNTRLRDRIRRLLAVIRRAQNEVEDKDDAGQ